MFQELFVDTLVDARVVDVALDDVGPLARDPLDGPVGEPVRARHLLPDQEPQAVGPVEVPGSLDLLFDNLRRLLAGKALRNVVTDAKGY